MNIPNLLTLARILLLPGIVIYRANKNFQAAFIIFIVAAFTDVLDGMVAKLFNQTTQLGFILDPIADKLLIGTSSLTLAILNVFPVWLAVMVISRDVIIILGIGILTYSQKDFAIRPHIDSKITTFLQPSTICFFLGKDIFSFPGFLGFYLTTATGLFTIFSGIRYIIAGFQVIED